MCVDIVFGLILILSSPSPSQDPAPMAPSPMFEELYRQHWPDIRSFKWPEDPDCVVLKFQVRMTQRRDISKINQTLRQFNEQAKFSYKINLGISLFLRTNAENANHQRQRH